MTDATTAARPVAARAAGKRRLRLSRGWQIPPRCAEGGRS
jgi:hypothetical protein